MPGDGLVRRGGRPRDVEKMEAVLDAGWALFLKHGVQAASIEAIAAQAGVSKVTLYKYYADKDALFSAAVQREMGRIEKSQSVSATRSADGAPLSETLRAFGVGLMLFLCDGPAVDFYSTLAGELRRKPALARAFYEQGPGKTRANLTAILAAAAARGELATGDAEEAAEHFFGLLQGFSNFQLALGIGVQRIRQTIEHRVERAVSTFLRAYGTTPAT